MIEMRWLVQELHGGIMQQQTLQYRYQEGSSFLTDDKGNVTGLKRRWSEWKGIEHVHERDAAEEMMAHQDNRK